MEKKVLAAIVASFVFVACAHWAPPPDERRIQLLTGVDGTAVASLNPGEYREPDGQLPNVIVWHGRVFERGWTQQGNRDANERLWFEITPTTGAPL